MYPMRFRRLRSTPLIRTLVREVHVSPTQFIQPLFVAQDLQERQEISGLKGVFRETPSSLFKQTEQDLAQGVKHFLLFGLPAQKKERNFKSDFVCQQIQALRSRFGSDLCLFVDVCLCSATLHGHCGVIEEEEVQNDLSVRELARLAADYAEAGADGVAPSDMMDGRIRAIRSALEAQGRFSTLILSYAAKFHSQFYGPFRLAAGSQPRACPSKNLKDRATYQIDPSHPRDAAQCARRDAEEGADILMVKPGLPYLDILKDLSQQIPKPWAVYHTSGEWAAIELLAEKGLISAPAAHLETWTAFLRAGASIIVSYGARWVKQYLDEQGRK